MKVHTLICAALAAALATSVAHSQSVPDADMTKVLNALQALEPKPIESLQPAEARKQPTPTDAIKKIIKDENLKIDPREGVSVANRPLADLGTLKLRFYTPENADKNAKLPIVVYFRGGGWVIADLDTYDATPAALARKANAMVVSVDYPLAPENKFPAAHDEAVQAYRYILKNAEGWGNDPQRIAIVGESAGGNLAINTTIAARDQGLTPPKAVVAVYPVATTSMDTVSKKEHANAKPLNTPMMQWFFGHVLSKPEDARDHRLNLVDAKLSGLPPITVINAEIDPLKSDGDLLVEKLKAAGVQVQHKVFPGVVHEFFGMAPLVAKAGEAQDLAVASLKARLTGN